MPSRITFVVVLALALPAVADWGMDVGPIDRAILPDIPRPLYLASPAPPADLPNVPESRVAALPATAYRNIGEPPSPGFAPGRVSSVADVWDTMAWRITIRLGFGVQVSSAWLQRLNERDLTCSDGPVQAREGDWPYLGGAIDDPEAVFTREAAFDWMPWRISSDDDGVRGRETQACIAELRALPPAPPGWPALLDRASLWGREPPGPRKATGDAAGFEQLPAADRPPLDQQINAAIRDLGDASFEVRERASRCISAYRATAEDALLRAAAGDDPEVTTRAKALLAIPRLFQSKPWLLRVRHEATGCEDVWSADSHVLLREGWRVCDPVPISEPGLCELAAHYLLPAQIDWPKGSSDTESLSGLTEPLSARLADLPGRHLDELPSVQEARRWAQFTTAGWDVTPQLALPLRSVLLVPARGHRGRSAGIDLPIPSALPRRILEGDWPYLGGPIDWPYLGGAIDEPEAVFMGEAPSDWMPSRLSWDDDGVRGRETRACIAELRALPPALPGWPVLLDRASLWGSERPRPRRVTGGAADIEQLPAADPPPLDQQIAAAIRDLGDASYGVREKASHFLPTYRAAAEDALVGAAASDDPEVRLRAKAILAIPRAQVLMLLAEVFDMRGVQIAARAWPELHSPWTYPLPAAEAVGYPPLSLPPVSLRSWALLPPVVPQDLIEGLWRSGIYIRAGRLDCVCIPGLPELPEPAPPLWVHLYTPPWPDAARPRWPLQDFRGCGPTRAPWYIEIYLSGKQSRYLSAGHGGTAQPTLVPCHDLAAPAGGGTELTSQGVHLGILRQRPSPSPAETVLAAARQWDESTLLTLVQSASAPPPVAAWLLPEPEDW